MCAAHERDVKGRVPTPNKESRYWLSEKSLNDFEFQ